MNILRTLAVLLLLLAVAPTLPAQVVSGRFGTSVYVWERFDTVDVSQTIARGFQTLQLEVTEQDVSLQTSLTGATNISQKFGNDAMVRVNTLYLRWKNIGGRLDLNAGRIPVFAGVGNGTVDGALLRLRAIGDKVVLTAYGGANVLPDLRSRGFNDLDKNFFAGGRLVAMPVPGAKLGISYVNRRVERESYHAVRPDSLFNPVDVLIVPDSRAQQAIGVDASFSPAGPVSGYGRYDYDLNAKRTLRGEFQARVQASEKLALTAELLYREPFLPFNSFFSLFPVSPIREVEGGAEYSVSRSLRFFGRYAYVRYIDALSRRISAGFSTDYISASYAGSSGYAGILNSFSVEGMYPLFKRTFTPTLGFSYAAYRLSEEKTGTDKIFAGSLGAVVRPLPAISADAQMQWLHTTVVDRDIRLLVKINYWFTHTFNLFGHKEAAE